MRCYLTLRPQVSVHIVGEAHETICTWSDRPLIRRPPGHPTWPPKFTSPHEHKDLLTTTRTQYDRRSGRSFLPEPPQIAFVKASTGTPSGPLIESSYQPSMRAWLLRAVGLSRERLRNNECIELTPRVQSLRSVGTTSAAIPGGNNLNNATATTTTILIRMIASRGCHYYPD